MAESVETKRGGGVAKGCCAGCAVVVVLLLVVGALAVPPMIKGLVTAGLEEVLQQQASAAEWDVQIDNKAAPKLFRGKPADIALSGKQVVVDQASGLTLERVNMDLKGLVVDRNAGKVSELASGTFELGMTSAQLDAAIASKMGVGDGQVTTAFEGTNLVLNGEVPLPQNLGMLKLSAKTTPKVIPPGSMQLAVDDLKLEPPAGMAKLPGMDLGAITKTMKDALSKEMTTELFKPDSGATLTSAAIEGDQLVIKGTISAEALSKGQ